MNIPISKIMNRQFTLSNWEQGDPRLIYKIECEKCKKHFLQKQNIDGAFDSVFCEHCNIKWTLSTFC